jgi:hypothetical protein
LITMAIISLVLALGAFIGFANGTFCVRWYCYRLLRFLFPPDFLGVSRWRCVAQDKKPLWREFTDMVTSHGSSLETR